MAVCPMFTFKTPCSIVVVSPSSCSKTVFVERLLAERRCLFDSPFNPVVYCYGADQPATFARMRREQGIHFYEGIPDTALLDKWFKKTKGGLLVLDDLMKESREDERVLHLFTIDSQEHHGHLHHARHVPQRQIRQNHLQERPLYRSLQEPPR